MAKIRFDPNKTFPLDEFDVYKHIPVFDEHEAYGTRKQVTKELLEDLALNCNDKFSKVGAAVPLTLGHTKDDAKEEDQPDVVGWAANFDVEPLLDTGRDALYADLYIRKKYSRDGKLVDEYPFRSVELWRTKKDISPIALLKTTPERDLPIIKYAAETTDDDPSTYYFSSPETKEKLMADAVMEQSSGFKELGAKIDNLVGMFQEFMQMLQEEEGGAGGDGKEDLLTPQETEKETIKKPDEKIEKVEEKPEEKNAKMQNTMPEKCAAMAAPSATNSFIPSQEKDKMSREAEVEKFNRMVKDEVEKAVKGSTEKLERENAELRQHYRRTEAEKLIKKLEDEHNVDFGKDTERQEELEMFAALSKESAASHYERIKNKYKRKPEKAPNSGSVDEVLRYGRLPDTINPKELGDPVAAQKLADEIIASGMKYDEYMRVKNKK